MGRTNPTYRDVLRAVRDDWRDYRRALRRPDRDRFDRLFEDAHRYADAGGYLNAQNPMAVVLFSIALAQEKRGCLLGERAGEQHPLGAGSDAIEAADDGSTSEAGRDASASDGTADRSS